jgi:sulfate adenylyltransferase subunit 2
LLRLAEKAFRPARFPFVLLHVDTGENFPETLDFRDRRVAELGERLLIASVQDSIDQGRVVEEQGPRASRNRLQTTTLLDAISEHRFDAAIGGARRDEERSRAKERILSFRDDLGQWDPKNQRPELWNLYNTRIHRGEHTRVFPLSNWTELDIWEYIQTEQLEVPTIYFAHARQVFQRDGMLYAYRPEQQLLPGEEIQTEVVRYRTVGDMSCTGGIRSNATTINQIVNEITTTRITERGETRADDKTSDAAMEERKQAGYF